MNEDSIAYLMGNFFGAGNSWSTLDVVLNQHSVRFGPTPLIMQQLVTSESALREAPEPFDSSALEAVTLLSNDDYTVCVFQVLAFPSSGTR